MSATVVIEGDKSYSGAVVWEGARVRSRRVHAGPLPCADRRARLFSVKTSPRHLVPGSSECARNRDGLAGSGEPGQGQAGPSRAGQGRAGAAALAALASLAAIYALGADEEALARESVDNTEERIHVPREPEIGLLRLAVPQAVLGPRVERIIDGCSSPL